MPEASPPQEKVIDIPDAYADPRFDPQFDPILGYRTNDIYCMPIINRDGVVVGVLELLNRRKPLDIDDIEFLSGVSVHVGLAVENAWLHREMVEKRKIERELDLAREIQRNFYPNLPEVWGGVEIAASSDMCEAVGGDYLDYFPLADGRFIIMLGDVSGKGIGAALVMTSLHATCRALIRHIHAIEKVAGILNDTLVENPPSTGTFVTLMIMLVDPMKQRFHYISVQDTTRRSMSMLQAMRCLSNREAGCFGTGLFAHLSYSREIVESPEGWIRSLLSSPHGRSQRGGKRESRSVRRGAAVGRGPETSRRIGRRRAWRHSRGSFRICRGAAGQ